MIILTSGLRTLGAQSSSSVPETSTRHTEFLLTRTEQDLSNLLLHEHLAESHLGDEVRVVAHAYVMDALPQLDSERKRSLVIFLFSANLINGSQPIVDLSNADLTQINLSHLDFSRVALNRADLRGANLSDATFVGAGLAQSDLEGTNLSQSDFTGANLEGASLQGASLSNAILDHADLFHATNVEPALSAVHTLSGTKLPDGTLHP